MQAASPCARCFALRIWGTDPREHGEGAMTARVRWLRRIAEGLALRKRPQVEAWTCTPSAGHPGETVKDGCGIRHRSRQAAERCARRFTRRMRRPAPVSGAGRGTRSSQPCRCASTPIRGVAFRPQHTPRPRQRRGTKPPTPSRPSRGAHGSSGRAGSVATSETGRWGDGVQPAGRRERIRRGRELSDEPQAVERRRKTTPLPSANDMPLARRHP